MEFIYIYSIEGDMYSYFFPTQNVIMSMLQMTKLKLRKVKREVASGLNNTINLMRLSTKPSHLLRGMIHSTLKH